MHFLKLLFGFFFILLANEAAAQELNARITVNASQVGSNVNKNTFSTLQVALNNFVNNRKWTTDNFLPSEKIDCNFLLTISPGEETDVYKAALTIQAGRPIFNSSYLSPIINYQDQDIAFKYVQYQQLEFNDNRVSGTDALVSNLTAIFAYYSYMIIAYNYDSYAQRGGVPYFQKAQNVVNNAPEARGIAGWKPFDGAHATRTRYWLVENMQNTRYAVMHDIYYNYYRKSLDKMFEDDAAARAEMLNVLNLLTNYNTDNINTMANQFFFQGKATELIKVFSKAPPQDRARASELLQKMDLTNSGRYKDEMK